MRQILSTLASFLISPMNWMILLLLIQMFSKNLRIRVRCRWGILAIFIIFTNSWLIDAYAKWWQPAPNPLTGNTTYSCAIVLGGFGSPDKNEVGFFNATSDRFIQALKLYKTGRVRHIVIAGGNGKIKKKGFVEAAWAKQQFVAMGVPDSVMYYEDKSENTADNALQAKRMIDAAHLPPPYLLVTSAQHIPRSTILFEKAGLPTTPFPCAYIAGKDGYDIWGIIPQIDILQRWDIYIKETLAYLWYKFK
jgi:uncharacterized SAM-binding protein YcdF (DUF218 family)